MTHGFINVDYSGHRIQSILGFDISREKYKIIPIRILLYYYHIFIIVAILKYFENILRLEYVTHFSIFIVFTYSVWISVTLKNVCRR